MWARSALGGLDAVTPQDGPNTRWGKPDADRGQLAVDPSIACGCRKPHPAL